MADRPLWVCCGSRVVGRIERDPLSFAYSTEWVDSSEAFAVSVSLPLSREPYGEAAVRAYFFNLLPEGPVRRRLAGRLGISEGNDYDLLGAIGGECAGSLAIVRSPADAAAPGSYRRLSDAEVRAAIESGGALSALDGAHGIRLSLAGAQDKLPVRVVDGALSLPIGNAASSHILKFDNRDFKHLPANEILTLRLAAALGLPTVRATLRRFGRTSASVVERYDRVERDGVVTRIHQEDFCQALGSPAERKYESEGGPSLAQCIRLIRDASAEPQIDALLLIRWQLFNAAVGNADGHAKNLSLLHAASGFRLAPFYDLVCTRAYPRLDRRLALHFGGSADPATLGPAAWQRAATDLAVGERFLRDTARDLVESVHEHLGPVRREVERELGRHDFLRSSVVPAIEAGTRRLRLSLTA